MTAADYLTAIEAGQALRRSPKTIRNLVAKHRLERKLIRVGRSRRWAMLLPSATVERLRVLCWPDLGQSVKKKVQ